MLNRTNLKKDNSEKDNPEKEHILKGAPHMHTMHARTHAQRTINSSAGAADHQRNA